MRLKGLLAELQFMLNRPQRPTRPTVVRKRRQTPPTESAASAINRQTKRVKINQDTLRIAQTPNQKRIWNKRVRNSKDKLQKMKSKATDTTGTKSE